VNAYNRFFEGNKPMTQLEQVKAPTLNQNRVREIFKGLETGDGAGFFEHVADDVDWTVMGTHPLGGSDVDCVAHIRVRTDYEERWHKTCSYRHGGEGDCKFFWPAPGPRPADHPGIPDVE
jgi:hypothetical protein